MIPLLVMLAASFDDPWLLARQSDLQRVDADQRPAARSAVVAHFTPVSLAATGLAFGKGKEIGLWNVRACNLSDQGLAVASGRVLNAAPQVRFLTNTQAVLLADLKVRRTKREQVLRVAKYASIGVAAFSTPWAAAAIPLLDQFEDSLVAQRPKVESVLAELMPEDVIALGPGACGTWSKFASIGRDARPLGPVEVH